MRKISTNNHTHTHTVELREIEERPICNPSLFDQLIAQEDSDSEQDDSFPLPLPLQDQKHETLTNQADITPLIDEDFFVVEAQNFIRLMEVNDAGKARSTASVRKPAKMLPKTKKVRDFCNCSRMKCDKRYCSCFKNGNSCGQTCQCKNCNNHPMAKKIVKITSLNLQPFWRFEWNTQQQP